MRLSAVVILAIFGASPALAIDDCLPGVWRVDMDGMADLMARQMNGSATPVAGDVSMTIDEAGVVNMVVNEMTLNVQVPNAPAMDVSVTGASSGTLTGEAGRWTIEATSYDLVGSADVLGQRMEIPIDSSTGVFGGGGGSYTCSETELLFESDTPDVRMPPRWTR